jgi:glycosyltransferase involved in cell wall biosynthesis
MRHPEMYSFAFRKYYSSVLPWITRRADIIICISQSERDHIEERLPYSRGKTRVVYQGISERFRNSDRPRKEPVILAVSSLNRHKNLGRLLLAFRSLLDQLPHRLVIIGAHSTVVSSDSEAVALIREMEATGRVLSPGYVSDQELAQWYARSDIFVLPSLFEGFGFPPLEAMASGCAVCCSRAPAMPEVCADAAMYFDPYDVEDMAATLLRVAQDDALKTRLRAAGEQRSRQFTWQRAAREMLEILR